MIYFVIGLIVTIALRLYHGRKFSIAEWVFVPIMWLVMFILYGLVAITVDGAWRIEKDNGERGFSLLRLVGLEIGE